MIRTLLLVASLVALCWADAQDDDSKFFGDRMGQGPFCDSKCIPGGDWTLRRDWLPFDGASSIEEEFEDKFIWFGDSPHNEFWAETEANGNYACGERLLDMQFTSLEIPGLAACRPEIIYLVKSTIDYIHGAGHMIELYRIQGSFKPTTNSWNQFVTAYEATTNADRVTSPWNLLRMIPEINDESITRTYDNDFLMRQVFIANYERNFCTLTMSIAPIETQFLCNYEEDDDDTQLPSKAFCENVLGAPEKGDFFIDNTTTQGVCESGAGHEQGCDVMQVKVHAVAGKRAVAFKALREISESIRTNQKVEIVEAETTKTKREFDQAIPNFGNACRNTVINGGNLVQTQPPCPLGYVTATNYYTNFWGQVGKTHQYVYVPFSSNVVSPFCAYRD